MNTVLVIGLLLNAIALPIVARRLWFLFRLVRSGQPAPDRVQGVVGRLGRAARTELVEVFGQRRLLQWTVPGLAHFFTFWAFVILGSVYLEAYGVLLGPDDFHIPVIGHWPVLGFAQDTIALLVLVAIATFLVIRMRNSPAKLGRKSRFKGSHEFGAYLVLFFIFNVIWTMFLFRGAASALENYENSGAYFSNLVGSLLKGLGLSDGTLHVLEGIGLLLHIGVMLVFLIEVVHSKHLHIMTAPINVLFKRQPIGLGAAKPLTAAGVPLSLDDLDEIDEETSFGVGKVQDFSWKGILDFATCTECGRCQSQCPAWNTEKPLSPKLMIMALRDHAYAAGPAILAGSGGPATAVAELERPLVGETEGDPWAPTGGGVIDPDVLWSCVTCGACVQQCPVDIEHVDHIVDMRRYQVLVESNFPAELNQLFKGMESKGNPWNMSPSTRMDWAKGLDFDVPVVGEDVESLDEVDWLFWVGCAGAYEDRAKKTTQAVAELLHRAGVSFAVLGNGETCTGDSARRAGNEFLFQQLAQQNIETFREFKVQKVVSTCAHCFNTLKNEYREQGIELEVVHHTQLLNRLVRDGSLTPMASGPAAAKRSITYHDPCYLGRHNQVYSPPRELLQVLPGASYVDMPRNSERSFCCGAGGARMWMEETIGERINDNRTAEAVATGADQIAVGCPFCRVMLSDGLTAAQASGSAREEVEVLDVAQLLLASVKGETATKTRPAERAAPAPSAAAAAATAAPPATPEAPAETPAEPAPASPAAPAAGGSLFDVAPTETPAGATAAPAAGGSLFDVAPTEPAPEATAAPAASGSLFDVAPTETPAEPTPAAPIAPAAGGSLFDIPAPEAASGEQPATPEPAKPAGLFDTAPSDATAEPAAAAPAAEIPAGSLFDIPAPAEAAAEPAAPPTEPAADQPVGLFDAAPGTTAPETEAAPRGLFDVEPAAGTTPEPAPEPTSSDDIKTVLDADDADEVPAAPPSAAAAPSSGTASQPRTDVDVLAVGSLFDIAAPSGAVVAATAPAAAPSATPDAPSAADAADSAGEPAPDEVETILDDDDDADDAATGAAASTPDAATESTPQQAAVETPTPATPTGAAHQPRTDADINAAESLFDL
ncbi:(Fe-S)-binding protein [Nocardioides sp.]|uniref:(Fe-S)-binding protein n=1 Tax=Nocardioides sp. TaxID=35761 RepID=UPI00352951E6